MTRLYYICILLCILSGTLSASSLLIDDFPCDDPWAMDFNALGQQNSYNVHGDSTLLVDVVETIRWGSSGGSLRITYNQPTTMENDAWYWWSFIKGIDITVYDALTFYVRGQLGGEKLRVGFEDAWGQGTYIYLDDVLSQGVTTTWQQVTIYFQDLGISDNNYSPSDVDKYSIQLFIIKNDDNVAHEGTFYIDNIQLSTTGKLIIEDFDIKDFKANYLGGQMIGESDNSVTGDIGCTLFLNSDSSNAYGGRGESLRLSYYNPPDSGNSTNYWTLYNFLRSEGGYDLTPYNRLSFKLKGKIGGEIFKVAVKDNSSSGGVKRVVDITNYLAGPLTTNWQDVNIPLSDFSGCDLSIIRSLEFFMEYPVSGEQSGTFYIDNLIISNSNNGRVLLIDDFNQSCKARNNLLKINSCETTGEAFLLWEVIKNQGQLAEEFYRDYGEEYSRVGGSLKLDFSTPAPGDKWKWLTSIEGMEINGYDFLVFWARGNTGGEKFKICLEDTLGCSSDLEISRYMPSGLTPTWSRFKISLNDFNFARIDDGSLKNISFANSDETLAGGVIFIDQIMLAKNESLITLEDSAGSIIQRLYLSGNTFPVYGDIPEKVTFYFVLSRQARIRLRIYNIGGQIVKTLLTGNSYYSAGSHTQSWDGRDDNGNLIQRGLYIFQIHAEDESNKIEKKMNLLEGY
ncbi:MAG: hypothetical protein JW827_12215 [Spirochaetes bacterium]|nr:hypothetical protein [Spirochaetota bacterium]